MTVPMPPALWWARRHGQRCRVCACTDCEACPGGCWWVEEDLCSSCVGKEVPNASGEAVRVP